MAGEPAQIGPYQIGKRIGQGGMGAVHEAVHETIGRRAAVKFLNESLARNPATLTRFFNEARAVSVVEHPGLVQIYDSGQLPNDGPAYIIMELIRGETLAERLKREKRLPVLQALRLGWQLSDTLAAVHEKDIVHRDIKPANLMIVPDPAATGRERLKILDFGIAKLASGIGAGDTRPGQVMGSPVYMAPEQCRGAAGVDSKADVYATGAVLYHMLAGQPPFDGETFAALVFMHLHEPLIPLTERGVDAPPALIDCVHSLLQKDPKLRPTMRETAEQLEVLLAETERQTSSSAEIPAKTGPASAPRPVVSPIDTARMGGDLVSTLGQSVGQSRITHWPPSRAALGAVAGGALVLALLLVALWPKGTDRAQPVSTPATPQAVHPTVAAAGSEGAKTPEKTRPVADPASVGSSTAAVADSSPTASPSAITASPKAEKPTPTSKPTENAKPSPAAVKSSASKPRPSPPAKRHPPSSRGTKSLGTKKAFPIIQ